MGRTCENCGSVVSERFFRVFYPEGADVKECIHCPESNENGFEIVNV